MKPDLWQLYRQMFRSRLFEIAVKGLWGAGEISGEMHLGIGEEAIVAAVVTQMKEGDALALDHRGTPPLVMRGLDLVALLREFLGHPDGLCGGLGGHMHLFSREHLAASSGIVGASGPAAAGFALAAQSLRPGTLAIAFFGEGAMNEGMLMESMNLAVAWKLPVLFVCKDNKWAITTPAALSTGGDLLERARSFGLRALDTDGTDVEEVWPAVEQAMNHIRGGNGPAFLRASCAHPEGHFLGDLLVRMSQRQTGQEMRQTAWGQFKAFLTPGGVRRSERVAAIRAVTSLISGVKEQAATDLDPLNNARQKLTDLPRLQQLEAQIAGEIDDVVEKALSPA